MPKRTSVYLSDEAASKLAHLTACWSELAGFSLSESRVVSKLIEDKATQYLEELVNTQKVVAKYAPPHVV